MSAETSPAASLESRVRGTMERLGMMPPEGQRILVACSGGADSLCLAHVLSRIGIPIGLAHFDHGLRGNEGVKDEAIVGETAKALGVDMIPGRAAPDEGADNRASVEMAARESRYGFLCATARSKRYVAIATAHHRDDQAETVLMRVIRGASIRGLGGIPPIGMHAGVIVIRPLIECSRDEIRAFLSDNDIAFREDETNADIGILRNRLRHELLPVIERDYNPHVRDALTRLASIAAEEDALLSEAAADFAEKIMDSEGAIMRGRFVQGAAPLQRRVLTAWIAQRGIDIGFDTIEALRTHILEGGTGKRVSIAAHCALENTRRRSRIIDPRTAPKPPPPASPLKLYGATEVMGHRFEIEVGPPPDGPIDTLCSHTVQLFDADRMGHAIAVRGWHDGDRIQPMGMKGVRKLQDWFTDAGVPKADRGAVPLVLAGDQIAWIVGGIVAEPFRVRPGTRRVLTIRVTPSASADSGGS